MRKSIIMWIIISIPLGIGIGHYLPNVGIQLELLWFIFIRLTNSGGVLLLFSAIVVTIGSNSMKIFNLKSTFYLSLVLVISIYMGADKSFSLLPENFVKAAIENQIIQIIGFSILFGIGLSHLNSKRRIPSLLFAEGVFLAMIKFVDMVMYLAPIGIGGGIAALI